MEVPVGHGLPGWLDTTRYLSAVETRGLPNHVNYAAAYSPEWRAGYCAKCSNWRGLHKAHIVRVGSSYARRRGTDGPQVGLCVTCHRELDEHPAEMCMAVRRSDGAICWVWSDGREKVLVNRVRGFEEWC